jgi:hypothetical protein
VVLQDGVGASHIFDSRTTGLVGRAANCTIQLPDDEQHRAISRPHCLLDIDIQIKYSELEHQTALRLSMAFDDNLAARIRHALARKKNIEQKTMFGGIGFLVGYKL